MTIIVRPSYNPPNIPMGEEEIEKLKVFENINQSHVKVLLESIILVLHYSQIYQTKILGQKNVFQFFKSDP